MRKQADKIINIYRLYNLIHNKVQGENSVCQLDWKSAKNGEGLQNLRSHQKLNISLKIEAKSLSEFQLLIQH